MPVYDFACTACGLAEERIVSMASRDAQTCTRCHAPLTRCFIGRAPTMIPDSIPGGVVVENLTPQPKRFYSRTEINDEMRVHGVRAHVRHVGVQGSDKNPHTTRWI